MACMLSMNSDGQPDEWSFPIAQVRLAAQRFKQKLAVEAAMALQRKQNELAAAERHERALLAAKAECEQAEHIAAEQAAKQATESAAAAAAAAATQQAEQDRIAAAAVQRAEEDRLAAAAQLAFAADEQQQVPEAVHVSPDAEAAPCLHETEARTGTPKRCMRLEGVPELRTSTCLGAHERTGMATPTRMEGVPELHESAWRGLPARSMREPIELAVAEDSAADTATTPPMLSTGMAAHADAIAQAAVAARPLGGQALFWPGARPTSVGGNPSRTPAPALDAVHVPKHPIMVPSPGSAEARKRTSLDRAAAAAAHEAEQSPQGSISLDGAVANGSESASPGQVSGRQAEQQRQHGAEGPTRPACEPANAQASAAKRTKQSQGELSGRQVMDDKDHARQSDRAQLAGAPYAQKRSHEHSQTASLAASDPSMKRIRSEPSSARRSSPAAEVAGVVEPATSYAPMADFEPMPADDFGPDGDFSGYVVSRAS